jgi:N-acetylglucosaminyl-diphospho-decaprenol L-rhamnosyltransferase
VRTSVVTLAHGRHSHLKAQQLSLLAGSVQPSSYVVVAIDDHTLESHLVPGLCSHVVHVPTHPAGLPLASARNAGVRHALDLGADAVILLDVDCLAGRELVAGYQAAVRFSSSVVWSGPVTYLPPPPTSGYDISALETMDNPHPARPAPPSGQLVTGASPDLFWSLSFACHRAAWAQTGGFCEDYVGYGGEDTDFAQLTVSRGIELGWTGTARAYHQHHPVSDPPAEHVEDILRNGRIFRSRWGWWPMEGWLTAFEQEGLVCRDEDGQWQYADVGNE